MTTFNLVPTTDHVSIDEKAYLLREAWRSTPSGDHRIQRIWVDRGGALAVYEIDLGPKESFVADQFQIPSGVGDDPPMFWAFRVGEIQELANRLREDRSPEYDRPPDDLIELYAEDLDERLAQRARRSVIGRYLRVQRG